MSTGGWVGVDLDGTLAKYDGWRDGEIGEPVPAMVERVRGWLAAGQAVKIFTARAAGQDAPLQTIRIREWCRRHIGVELPVTSQKDYACIAIYDDRAVQVEPNTGRIIGE